MYVYIYIYIYSIVEQVAPLNQKQTMDDRTWIREDTLTMQLAIPPDLCIYAFTISTYIGMKWYKI